MEHSSYDNSNNSRRIPGHGSPSTAPMASMRAYMSHPPGTNAQHNMWQPHGTTAQHETGDSSEVVTVSRPAASSFDQRSYHNHYSQTWQSPAESPVQYSAGRAAGQTVTARMVDPSVASSDFGSNPVSAACSPSMRSRPVSSTSRHGASGDGSGAPQPYSQQQQQQQQQQKQQIQPTIAALALADSQGQLGSELGYYTPQRLRADSRLRQGFRSQPVSGSASPVSATGPGSGQGYEYRTMSGTGSAGSSGLSSASSALGVVFSAPVGLDNDPDAGAGAYAKTITRAAALQRPGNSSNLGDGPGGISSNARMGHSSRDALQLASSSSPPSSSIYAHGGSHSQLSVLPENASLKSYAGGGGGSSENNVPYHTAQSSAEFTPHTSSPISTPSIAASATAASSSFSFRNSQRALSHYHYSSSQP
ncbi:hypothetical protein LPJ57_007492, partial [Coemansia sp. RSA 486]